MMLLSLCFSPLEDRARIWYEKEPPNSILTWDDLVNQFFPPLKTTHLKNEISRFTQRFKETFSEAWDRFKELLRACPHHGFSELTKRDTSYNGLTEKDQDSLNAASGGNLLNKKTREALQIIENKSKISNLVEIVNKQVISPAKAVEKTCVTCGGAHAYYECIATNSNPSSVCAATGSYNHVSRQTELVTIFHHLGLLQFKTIQIGLIKNQPSTSGTLSSNTVPNPKGEMKAVTTRSGLAYEGPSFPTEPPLEKVDEQNTEEILDKEHSNSSVSTAQVQPSVMPISIPKPDVPRTQTKPTIPFADALLLMPKFALTIKCLLANKDKLFELAKVLLNENCSAMLLKKLPKNLGDPKKLSLPKLTPTWMTIELADRSITRPKEVTEDVFIKVGKFHFPTDFVVVDFEANPRVPLILGRSFLRTGRALIDVYGEEITLRAKSPIKKPEYSFSIGYEHFITTPVTELDEVAEFSAKNLVPIPSEYKDDFMSNDNESIHDEDVPIEESKVYSNPLFDDDKIYSDKLESHCLNVETNLIESLSNHDTVKEEIDIVTDTDELLPLGFENNDSEEEIYVLEELRVDNSILNFKNELSDFDHDNPSFTHPPSKPPYVEFDFEPNS
nr:reverse transcriptase domain-containing protein [Tanacetum cinerariifolium]